MSMRAVAVKIRSWDGTSSQGIQLPQRKSFFKRIRIARAYPTTLESMVVQNDLSLVVSLNGRSPHLLSTLLDGIEI